ncbi:Fic family protein [Myroides phaeus]|uniref:Fic/DOC family protein n=1 Tax=Myroides phaeus TaxID=702745 RepID=A0A1G8GCD5_9FLAO|nr:DNA-binding protein [Myroides phaeus]SDH92082.1 Fic/DOC family protein [Myroides phaeus]
MIYISVKEFAQKQGVSETTVRNHCTAGKIEGAFKEGRAWSIPVDAVLLKSSRAEAIKKSLLEVLQEQKGKGLKKGIYHRTQVEFTYNSNRIKGTELTRDQTRHIFETNTVGTTRGCVNVDDVIETANHFRCIDMIIENAEQVLTEESTKKLHARLKVGTSDNGKPWFNVGKYKQVSNDTDTYIACSPEEVEERMRSVFAHYQNIEVKTIEDVVELLYQFESIRPFQDCNGRIARLILYKECLANQLVPFFIEEEMRDEYFKGIGEWPISRERLLKVCLKAQSDYQKVLKRHKLY